MQRRWVVSDDACKARNRSRFATDVDWKVAEERPDVRKNDEVEFNQGEAPGQLGAGGFFLVSGRPQEADEYTFKTTSHQVQAVCTAWRNITSIEVTRCEMWEGGSIYVGLTPDAKTDMSLWEGGSVGLTPDAKADKSFGENGLCFQACFRAKDEGDRQRIECKAGSMLLGKKSLLLKTSSAPQDTVKPPEKDTTGATHFAKIFITNGQVTVKVRKNTKTERFFLYAQRKSLLEGASQMYLQVSVIMALGVEPWDISFPGGVFFTLTYSVLASMVTFLFKTLKATVLELKSACDMNGKVRNRAILTTFTMWGFFALNCARLWGATACDHHEWSMVKGCLDDLVDPEVQQF